jgi:hypothetical protein
MNNQKIASYKAFWHFYVNEHRSRLNRNLHFLGTSLTLLWIVLATTNAEPKFLIGMPVTGYGFAWAGHFFFEKNHPATFRHPLWSLIADFQMFFLMCVGRMDREVKLMGILSDQN